MDSQITSVLIGVLANGLAFFTSHILRKSGKFIIGEKLIEKMKQSEESIRTILKKSLDNISEKIEWKGPPRLEKICLFITSPEVETIVRQIYATNLTEVQNSKNLKLIKKEFLKLFSIYFDLPIEKIKNSANLLFMILIKGCEESLKLAINKGILSAHEAESAFRHQILINELDSIKKNLEFLTKKYKPNIKEFIKFEAKYRKQVGDRHSYISPPHFDVVRRIAINDLYVPPSFITTPLKKGQEPLRLSITHFLSCIYRAVILGNPGCGKSTFIHKLCHDLAENYSKCIFSGRKVTPIPVILREYGTEKKDNMNSIVQFIEKTSCSRYQLEPPEGAFEYLLNSGRVIIVFDGLDELLDTSYRQEIGADVESFCKLYPSVPVIVTSREVGYEQAPLNENNFEIFQISDFNENQVKEYSKKWFSLDIDLTLEQQKQKAEAFYEESNIVPDLRANPLMLALMCNIYRGENYIPRNKPDIYEKCAIMLFERWDKSRCIHVKLPFEVHIKPAMMYLAHWIYSKESLQSGITEYNLIKKTTQYLYPKRFEDHDEAEMSAREFINFCKGRAWVFTDTGTTKDGERLYQFTHRTFLEYFTAAYIVRTNSTPDHLRKVLMPKINKREWDVVAQIAYQLQNKNIEGAGDELLSYLLDKTEMNIKNKMNKLSFAIRCLEFIIPSPKITRNITTAIIDQIITLIISKPAKFKSFDIREYALENLENLLNSAVENLATIADCIKNLIIEKVNAPDDQIALLYLELALILDFPFKHIPKKTAKHSEILNIIEKLNISIEKSCYKRIKFLQKQYFIICHIMYDKSNIQLKHFIKWHGIESIFYESSSSIYNIYYSPIVFGYLNTIIYKPYKYCEEFIFKKEHFEEYFTDISYLYQFFLKIQTPWIKKEKLFKAKDNYFYKHLFNFFSDTKLKKNFKYKTDELFVGFILFGIFLEYEKGYKQIFMLTNYYKLLFSKYIYWILKARFEKVDTEKVKEEINKIKFSKEEQSLIWKWIHKEINFLK